MVLWSTEIKVIRKEVRKMEITPNGLDYVIESSTINGIRVRLFCKVDHTSGKEINQAKEWLYKNKKALNVAMSWMNEDGTPSETQRIPDFLVIKGLSKELGEKDSYIQELEDKLKKHEEKGNLAINSQVPLSKEERKEIRKDEIYKQQKEEILALRKKVGQLKKDVADLITKLNQKTNTNQ